MILITPFIIIILFIILVIVALIIAYLSKGKDYDNSNFKTFVAVLSGLGIFLTFIFYYNLIQLQHDTVRTTLVDELNDVKDRLLTNVYGQMEKALPIIPDFVFSINPLSKIYCDECAEKDSLNINENTRKACIQKMILSEKIFYLWQDIVSAGEYVKKNRRFFIMQFLQQAHSKQLKKQWEIMDNNYSYKTKQLGDLLFEYADKIDKVDKETFTNTLDELFKDKRYNEIFKSDGNTCYTSYSTCSY